MINLIHKEHPWGGSKGYICCCTDFLRKPVNKAGFPQPVEEMIRFISPMEFSEQYCFSTMEARKMIGIGIDTGGTCTDAVTMILKRIPSPGSQDPDHAPGPEGWNYGGPAPAAGAAAAPVGGQAALPTTLATNACVENPGGRGKIIFSGVSRKVFTPDLAQLRFPVPRRYPAGGLPHRAGSRCVGGADWEAFREKLPAFLEDCDCVSVVQLYAAADHGGAFELKARDIIRSIPDFADMPVILGNTLFADRNAIRRGAGALLNARLVPVVCSFMTAIREVFESFRLEVPITIIRSDGSQMSEAFAQERPVETLLCGPAASVIGACALSDAPNALVVDMGGTTTDIAIVKNRIVRRAQDGIQVGDWKTFVKGLYVDTFRTGRGHPHLL